jgi:isovaleryl-CoA dehydrogenase
MRSDFDANQRKLYANFSALGEAIGARAPEHDAAASLDWTNWRRITEAGLWRLPVPRELGGYGRTWSDCAAAIEGVASTANDLGFMITMLGHLGSIRVLLDEGAPHQLLRWLEPLMQGEIGVTAMTESGGGSDLARMCLAAEQSSNGEWTLSGQKVHITNAPVASHGLIAGRMSSLPKKRDITLFFVDLPAAGLSLGPCEENLGIRSSPTADMLFDRVKIDQGNIIGTPGDGLRILYRVIAFERALYGVIASGLIDGMIGQAMDRIEERHAFGKPLADYQYVQGRITDMKMASITCRLLCYAGIKEIDADGPDASIICSTTKFLAGERLLEAAEHLVQLHGHLGFMNNGISRLLRDAVGMRIAGGTSDIQRVNIFNQMRAHRRAQPSSIGLAAE